RGDLGISYRTDRSVLASILERVPATATLAVAALGLAILIGVATGIIAALRQNTMFDSASIIFATIGVSIPNFWLGLLLIYLLVDSIAVRDLPMVQGCVLFIATVFIGLNLCVDLSYVVLDPRIKYE